MQPDGARPYPVSTSFSNELRQVVRTVIQIGQVHQFQLASDQDAEPAHTPIRVGTVPDLAAARQSRRLDARLSAALGSPGGTSCLVLSGMGGAGKTQAAAVYAHDQWRSGSLDLLVWVNAASRDAVIATYAQAAAAIGEAVTAEIEANAAKFHAWLDRPLGLRWLVVLDDLQEPADLNGLWPPVNPDGRAVVTTRRRDAALDGARRDRASADLFTESECLAFLRERLGGDADRLTGARELAAELGRLPLALAQAAAFILDQPGMSCGIYRDMLADRSIALTHLRPDSLPDGHDRAVAAAWSLSIKSVDSLRPTGAATALLRLLSLLDPNGVPVAVADSRAAVESVHAAAEASCTDASSGLGALAVRRMLGRLRQMSLIEHDGETLRVHSLIQRAVYDEMPATALAVLAPAAAEALLEVWPVPERYSAFTAILRSNVAYLWRSAERELLRDRVHEVLFRAGDSLGSHGRTERAMRYFEELQSAAAAALGEEHPDVLRTRLRIAHWQKETGDIVGALEALAELLPVCGTALGPEHPVTFEVRTALAKRRGECGDENRAARELEAVVEDQLRVLGAEHPGTLDARFGLARWRGRAGDQAYVIEVLRQLLAELRQQAGPDDQSTLAVRSSLARWMGRTGDLTAAVEGYERLLADRTRILGARHPDTLNARYHLATWTGRSGRRAEAVIMLEKLVPDLAAVHGPAHSKTLRAEASLACWYGESGEPHRAWTSLAELVPRQSAVLGPDHPHTLKTRHNLGRFQSAAGDRDAAYATLSALVADRRRVLGADHPTVRATRIDLESLEASTAAPE
ncbi:FxSxx-COOH system tetratricopeptide repeat protein [Glycomyces sp. YM15]|uniref:FxSxx-COOH system tetratricopeptide repeat protein n=1 Tax=Glycomyces sp. YM15 TaxID=2800446 RepID=UPI0023DD0C0D|nr:FxSxx-COOH system tetratricopeptide repeat protein [Glycomyces sp. YM15]